MKPDDLAASGIDRDGSAAEGFRPLLLAAAWRIAATARETLDE